MHHVRSLTHCVMAVLLGLALAPRAARACGPGVHVAHAERLLALLVESDPAWQTRAEAPMALTYLRMGAIAPDLQWAADELSFGHSAATSLHLLERAEAGDDPLLHLFALGHLAHTQSDPACEAFFTPTLFATAPLGLFDVLEGFDDAQGESEGVVETLGDFVLGDWKAVVDVVFDLWLEGPEAEARGRALVDWYCRTGSEPLADPPDCANVLLQLEERMEQAKGYLGTMDRAGVQMLLASLQAQPLTQVAELVAGGSLDSILGEVGAVSPNIRAEVARLQATPLVDRAFWHAAYDPLADLGPRWTIARLATRLLGFPSWDPNAIVCGNVQSVMQSLPDEFDVVPGLLVDAVEWVDGDGAPVASVDEARAGTTLHARVTFFSAYPFEGTVRGVVRRDRPGLVTSDDTPLGEAALEVAIDPTAYATTPRTTLEVPFTVDLDGALGFYLELTTGATSAPWFTTSWDRLWLSPTLDVDRPLYRDHFGTYGHWPPSLPIAAPSVSETALFVKVRIAPHGPGLGGAVVGLAAEGPTAVTAPNGIASFAPLAPGLWTPAADVPGYAPAEPVALTLAEGETRWSELALHAVPAPVLAPWTADPQCVEFDIDLTPFGGEARAFVAALGDTDGTPLGAPAVVPARPFGSVCADAPLSDGTAVAVQVRARYADGSEGVLGVSAPGRVDASPPAIAALTVAESDRVACLPSAEGLPRVPPLEVALTPDEPHAPLTAVTWRVGDVSGAPEGLVLPREGSTGRLVFVIDDAALPTDAPLVVSLTNAAGLVGTSAPVALPVWDAARVCPPDPGPDVLAPDAAAAAPEVDAVGSEEDLSGRPEPDVTAAEPDVAGEDVGGTDLTVDTSDGEAGGCSAATAPSHGPLVLVVLAALLLAASARSTRRSLLRRDAPAPARQAPGARFPRALGKLTASGASATLQRAGADGRGDGGAHARRVREREKATTS